MALLCALLSPPTWSIRELESDLRLRCFRRLELLDQERPPEDDAAGW